MDFCRKMLGHVPKSTYEFDHHLLTSDMKQGSDAWLVMYFPTSFGPSHWMFMIYPQTIAGMITDQHWDAVIYVRVNDSDHVTEHWL